MFPSLSLLFILLLLLVFVFVKVFVQQQSQFLGPFIGYPFPDVLYLLFTQDSTQTLLELDNPLQYYADVQLLLHFFLVLCQPLRNNKILAFFAQTEGLINIKAEKVQEVKPDVLFFFMLLLIIFWSLCIENGKTYVQLKGSISIDLYDEEKNNHCSN